MTTPDAPRRFTTQTGDGLHITEADLPKIEGEDAGIPGGLTDAMREAEKARVKDMPVVGPVDGMLTAPNAGGPHVYAPATLEHDVDPDSLHRMEFPRHNMYAQENMEGPGPDRVIPGGPTNAHPDFAVDQFGNPEPNDSVLTTAGDLSTTGVVPAADDRPAETEREQQAREERAQRFEEREAEVAAASAADKAKEAAVIDEAAAPPDSPQAGIPVEDLVPTGAAAVAAEEVIAAAAPVVVVEEPEPGLREKAKEEKAEKPEPAAEWEPREEATAAPPHSADKATWVEHVVANYEITTADAEAMTKADLIETYGERDGGKR